MNRPRLVLTELREYRSERTGNTYFSGYLGKARVVMLRDERAECTGKEVARWNVLLEEPEPRDGRENRASTAQDGRGGARTARSPRSARRSSSGPPEQSPTPVTGRAKRRYRRRSRGQRPFARTWHRLRLRPAE